MRETINHSRSYCNFKNEQAKVGVPYYITCSKFLTNSVSGVYGIFTDRLGWVLIGTLFLLYFALIANGISFFGGGGGSGSGMPPPPLISPFLKLSCVPGLMCISYSLRKHIRVLCCKHDPDSWQPIMYSILRLNLSRRLSLCFETGRSLGVFVRIFGSIFLTSNLLQIAMVMLCLDKKTVHCITSIIGLLWL